MASFISHMASWALNHLDFGLTIQEAIDAPRFNHLSGNDVRLEHGIAFDTCKTLKKMGHNVILSPGDFFGGSQAVLVDPSTGTFFGASDPRKDGAALGY